MKKTLVALCLLIIVALAWVFLSRREPDTPFAGSFPSGAIGYAAVKDGGALAREVTQTNFWKALRRIGSAREAGRGLEGKGEAETVAALSAMLGDEAAVAVYGEKSAFGTSALGAVRTAEARGALRQFVLSGLKAAPSGAYAGMDLYAFGFPGGRGFSGTYAAGGDVGFVAVSTRDPEGLVKAAIDLREGKGKAPALLGDRAFSSGIGRRPAGGGGTLLACAWMDEEALGTAAKARTAAAAALGGDSPAAAAALAGTTPALPVVSSGGYLYRDRGFRGMLRERFDRARLSTAQRAALAASPGPLGVLALAPKGTIAVMASRIGDAGAAWRSFTANSNPVGSLAAGWLREYGIDFEKDVAPWVGDEASVQLSAVQAGGIFPLPRAEIVAAVKDRRAAERTILRVMEQAAGAAGTAAQQPWAFLRPEITRAEHRGITVTTLSYPVPGLSPSFGFIGARVVIGLDRSSVHQIIDTAEGVRQPLVADPVFAEMRAGLPPRLNDLVWIDGEGALRAGEGVANWVLAVKRLARSVSDEPAPETETRFEEELPRVIAAARVVRAAMGANACGRDTVDRYLTVRMQDIGSQAIGNPLPRR